jgi:ABC-2 type transport system permease protein
MRSRLLYGLVGLFVLFGGIWGYHLSPPSAPEYQPIGPLLFTALSTLVGLLAVGISQESIVGPRTDGGLQVLLGLPYSRGDFVLGTLVGRSVVLGAAILGFCVALVVGGLVGGVVPAIPGVAAAAGLSMVAAVVFAGIGVGVSAATRSTWSAAAISFVAALVLLFFWPIVPRALATALNGFAPPATPPAWIPLVNTLSPVASLGVLATAVFGGSTQMSVVSTTLQAPALAAGVVLAWLTLPTLLGYLRFRRGDL